MKVKCQLLDENNNIILNKNINKTSLLKETTNVISDLKPYNDKDFLDNFNEIVNVLIPYNNCKDYVIQYSNFSKSPFNPDISDYILFNKSFFKLCPLMMDLGFKEIFDEVYKTGNSRNIKLLYYGDNSLLYESNQKIFKHKNNIVIIFYVESKFKLIDENEIELLYNAPDPLMIIQDQKIVEANSAIEKITGYTPSEIIGKNFYFNNPQFKRNPTPSKIHEIYTKIIKKEMFNYTDILTLKHKNGQTVYVKSTMQPSRFNGKPAALFYAFDITEGVNHQIRAEKLDNTLNMVSDVSKIAYIYWDCHNGFEWSDEFYNIIEEKKEDIDLNDDIIQHYIVKEEFERVNSLLFDELKKTQTALIRTKIETQKGIKDIELYVDCKTDKDGKLVQGVGYLQDISEKVWEQKELRNLNNEKEILLKEVHHRVKNNLQIISSLLNLNMHYKPNKPTEILESTKNRINSMATVHKKIYQSNDNVHINLKEYIEEEVQNISKRNKKPNINLDFNLDDVKVGIDKAIPLSLIISGIINNSFAYAFPSNEKGNIKISLEKNSKGLIKLLIADNGIGLPSNVNIENPKDVGIILIKSLTEQIEGSIELLPLPGTAYEINFTD